MPTAWGDPVNRVDPTGHASWLNWIAFGLGMYAFGGAMLGAAAGMKALSAKISFLALPALAVDTGVLFLPEGKARDLLGTVGTVLSVAAAASASRALLVRYRATAAARAARRREHLELIRQLRGQSRRTSGPMLSDETVQAIQRQVDQMNLTALPRYDRAISSDLPGYAEATNVRSTVDSLSAGRLKYAEDTAEAWV